MKRKAIAAAALTLLAIVFTILAATVDRLPIAPDASMVGFGTLNDSVRGAVGTNEIWYRVTEILGYLAIAVAAGFAVLGVIQWIARKSIRRVDPAFFPLGGLYALTALLYFLFDKVVINVRPVLEESGEAESSFPSSHTMLAVVVFFSAVIMLERLVEHSVVRNVLAVLCGAAAGVTVIGRLLSGVHWMTDIVGGVLYSAALLMIFSTALSAIPVLAKKQKAKKKQS